MTLVESLRTACQQCGNALFGVVGETVGGDELPEHHVQRLLLDSDALPVQSLPALPPGSELLGGGGSKVALRRSTTGTLRISLSPVRLTIRYAMTSDFRYRIRCP